MSLHGYTSPKMEIRLMRKLQDSINNTIVV